MVCIRENIPALSWRHMIAFARDPVALYDATTLAWDTWTGECLGAKRVNPWRDGVACATGFPGPGPANYGKGLQRILCALG